MGGCQKGGSEGTERGRGLRGTNFQLQNKPRGCNIQHKEYGQQYCNNFIWGTDGYWTYSGDHFIMYAKSNHYVVHMKLI